MRTLKQTREDLLSPLNFRPLMRRLARCSGCSSWDGAADDRRLDCGGSIGASSRFEGRSVRSSSIRIACLQRLCSVPSLLIPLLILFRCALT